MQKLRNLRLAARLGVAFGALALGLLVVSLVAFVSTADLTDKVDSLADDVPAFTDTVDGVAARLPEEAHLLAQHLYVHDGDLAEQDDLAAQFDALAKQDEQAFGVMLQVLGADDGADATEALADGRALQASHAAFVADVRRALEGLARRDRRGATRTAPARATIYDGEDPPGAGRARGRRRRQRRQHDRVRGRRGRRGPRRDRAGEAR